MNLEYFRTRLETERDELLSQQADLQSMIEIEDDNRRLSQHSADSASDMFLRDRAIAAQRNAEDLIAQIDVVIERIELGTYGICLRCSQPITEERLEARPYAVYCVSCQAIEEGAALQRPSYAS